MMHDTDRRRNEYGYSIQCVQCDKWFDSKRIDASFCNSSCRSRYQRKLKQRQINRDKFQAALDTLIKQLPRHGGSTDFDLLQKAATRIQNVLSLVED